jgi:hypothetical protein
MGISLVLKLYVLPQIFCYQDLQSPRNEHIGGNL